MIVSKIDIKSKQELDAFAMEVLPLILKRRVVLLKGDLGAGKTTFVKSIGQLLNVEELVSSPTFSLINEYEGKHDKDVYPIYHMDLYRIEQFDELIEIGIEEYFDQDGIIFIEWPDIAAPLIPKNAVTIEIELFENSNRRINLIY